MTQKVIIAMVIVVVILALALVAFNWNEIRLANALDRYNRMVSEELPEDITLTIYYLRHDILTGSPLTVEDLIELADESDHAYCIQVERDILMENVETLRKLNSSQIQIAENPDPATHFQNVRFYYVFESAEEGKILEVMAAQLYGHEDGFCGYVNGIPVTKNTMLYEIVMPFLSAEDLDNLNIP